MPFISFLENWNLLHSNFDVHEEPKANTKHLHGGHGFAKCFRKNRLQAKLQLRVKKLISLVFSQCLQKRSWFFDPKIGKEVKTQPVFLQLKLEVKECLSDIS